jgi:hypothetical protein
MSEEELGEQLSFLKDEKDILPSPIPPSKHNRHKPIKKTSSTESNWFDTLPGILAIQSVILGVGIVIYLLVSHIYGVALGFSFVIFGCWLFWHAYRKQPITQRRWLLILLTSFALPISAGYFVANTIGKSWEITHKPQLTIPYVQITSTDNQTGHTTDVTFSLHISNVGNAPAYQIHCRQCEVDADLLETNPSMRNLAGHNERNSANLLQPQEGMEYQIVLRLPYKYEGETKIYDNKRLFLYFGIDYSDVPDGNLLPPAAYWYSYDINKPTILSNLTIEQKAIFKPIVDQYLLIFK